MLDQQIDGMPDKIISMNSRGFIVEGEVLRPGANLFDYVDSEHELDMLKNALQKAEDFEFHTIRIGFKYKGKRIECLCRIFLEKFHYWIGFWSIPNNLIPFPI